MRGVHGNNDYHHGVGGPVGLRDPAFKDTKIQRYKDTKKFIAIIYSDIIEFETNIVYIYESHTTERFQGPL